MKTKPVSQLKNNTVIARYPSVKMASQLTNTQSSHIGKVTSGNRKKAGGYSWHTPKTFNGRISKNHRGIQQLTKSGDVVAVYESIEVAAMISGLSEKRIQKVLDGGGKVAGGYNWL